MKKYDCRVADAGDNRSLLIPMGYGNYDYFCAHCFFDRMNIFVPEELKNNFSIEEHVTEINEVNNNLCDIVESILLSN